MRALLLSALGVIAGVSACSGVVSTRVLADAFNGGALDGTPDPFYRRSQRGADTLAWRMRDELGEGYFEQGSSDARVVRWLRHLGGAFLATLSTLVHGTVARKVALDLLGRHEALLGDWVTYEERTALAAQNGRRLTEVWTYAPVPIELRAYLGCDASADPGKPLPRPTCSE
jgi:hypothetical protein